LTGDYIADPIVEEAIEKRFDIIDRYFYFDQPRYTVSPIDPKNPKISIKKGFEELVGTLRPLGYLPKLGGDQRGYTITLHRFSHQERQNYSKNILLFGVTSVTIFVDGYLRSNNPILYDVLMQETPVFINALYFTLAILAVFGIHELGELGHKALTMLRGIEASMPYFIPAPPGMGGTFGAVITQKEPPTNRDALFDLGLSGPLMGFLVTIIVTIIGLKLSFIVPLDDVNSWMVLFPEVRFQPIPFPLLFNWLASIIRPVPDGMVLILHPVAFAAWVGSLVTFINLIPAWQLDGGHISRALLGGSYHRIMSMGGILLMLLSGYYVMALMIAFFLMRTDERSDAPLDDISPLSMSRKVMVLVYLGMMVLTLVSIFPF
jgi:membrane-associated protease RseP (regulator of RpoE activity)